MKKQAGFELRIIALALGDVSYDEECIGYQVRQALLHTTFPCMAVPTIASTENPVKTIWLWYLCVKQFLLVSSFILNFSLSSLSCCPWPADAPGCIYGTSQWYAAGIDVQEVSSPLLCLSRATWLLSLHSTWWCSMRYWLTLRESCCGAGGQHLLLSSPLSSMFPS